MSRGSFWPNWSDANREASPQVSMKRWLERNHWPYVVNIASVPLVAHSYYNARLNGTAPPVRQLRMANEQEPDFDSLRI